MKARWAFWRVPQTERQRLLWPQVLALLWLALAAALLGQRYLEARAEYRYELARLAQLQTLLGMAPAVDRRIASLKAASRGLQARVLTVSQEAQALGRLQARITRIAGDAGITLNNISVRFQRRPDQGLARFRLSASAELPAWKLQPFLNALAQDPLALRVEKLRVTGATPEQVAVAWVIAVPVLIE
ncbi:MAG: hypothetical protein KGJ12_06440, partial [Gammaproteobacteria bacterium]|nr:hypothetical protein [Gammaproteobacteria bacterium]